MISYKFRIYPSKTVQERLNEQIELCRWLYNRLLWECNKAREEGRKLTKREAQAMIAKLKEENPELKKVYSKVLQMVNHQLFSNMKALSGLKKKGRKIGKLRYKKGWFKTLNFNQSGFKLSKRLSLSKVGEIPIKLHREIKGDIKGVIIKKEKSGRWFAIFQVEDEPKPLPKTNREVGIDVGITHFLTDSDGRQIENPRFYEKSLERIKCLLAKDILDSSWNKFFEMLSYKAENAGRIVLKVNPRGTSKEYRYGELDRDYNASLNILERGLSGQGLPFEPVETRPLREIPASLVIEAGSPIQSLIG